MAGGEPIYPERTDYHNMSNDQLDMLRRARLRRAVEGGFIRKVITVVKELGDLVDKFYGTMTWAPPSGAQINVRFVKSSGELTVHVSGILVCRDRAAKGKPFIIPGRWQDVIREAHFDADERVRRREHEECDGERAELLSMLRFPPKM
jgi:hypothetical protein